MIEYSMYFNLLSIGLGLGTVIDVRNGNASWGAAKDKEEQSE